MADDYNLSGITPISGETSGPEPSSVPTTLPTVSSGTISDGYNLSGLDVTNPDAFIKSSLDDRYGGTGQTALAAIEGGAQGVLGPIAPALERASGLTTADDIRGRALAHPIVHGLSEAATFGASAAFGDELGLSGVVGEAGNAAAHIFPGVAGVKTAAELATITASNEFSKMVEKDPNQTLGSAAINVGLSGIVGGIGGNLLDKLNPLKYFAKNAMRARATDTITGLMGGIGSGITGAAIGSGIGATVGLPGVGSIVGGVIGEKVLSPVFNYLSRPLAEKLANLPAAEAAYDYLYSANQGQKALNNYLGTFFERGAQTVNLSDIKGITMPSQASRDDLKNILEKAQNMDKAIDIGTNLNHYLPEHTVGAAQTTSNAVNYFNSLKPVQMAESPLDKKPPIDKASEANYNRQLDVAQQPLMALQHVKNGNLLPQDMQTLRTIWPGVHDSLIQKLTDGIIKNKEAVQKLPYAQRNSLSMFIGGNPLETTMSPQSAQAIIRSSSPQSLSHSAQVTGHARPSSATLNQLNKVDALGATSLQAREFQRRR